MGGNLTTAASPAITNTDSTTTTTSTETGDIALLCLYEGRDVNVSLWLTTTLQSELTQLSIILPSFRRVRPVGSWLG